MTEEERHEKAEQLVSGFESMAKFLRERFPYVLRAVESRCTRMASISIMVIEQAAIQAIAALPGAQVTEWGPRAEEYIYVNFDFGPEVQLTFWIDKGLYCTAIKETVKVVKQVPVTFEDQEIEEERIVGWECPAEVDGVAG